MTDLDLQPILKQLIQEELETRRWYTLHDYCKLVNRTRFTRLTKKPKGKQEKAKKSKNTKQKQPESRITLIQLTEADVLSVPMVLTKKYKGQTFKSTITTKGTIELSINGEVEFNESPSAAAVVVSGQSQNSWTWWLDSAGALLDKYRLRYNQEFLTSKL